MKILTSAHIHELDKYTIQHEPIKSIDLMERAAKAITEAIMRRWTTHTPIVTFAGPGNNGGDALAVSRMLADQGYSVRVYLFNITGKLSDDCSTNRQRIIDDKRIKSFMEVTTKFDIPELDATSLIIDGLFGSGVNKPLAGGFAALVKYINQCPAKVVSIDMPSGLMTEDNSYNVRANIIRADYTLTLHSKKLSMYLADCQEFLGKVQVLDIRLNQEYMRDVDATYRILEEKDIRPRLLPRNDFAHKGSMGNALIIAGSYGMSGAAILSARACLRAGAGKVTVHTPRKNYDIMQTSVPEAVLHMDHEETYFSESVDSDDFDAVAIGPGLGQQENSAIAFVTQMKRAQCPVVVDADAINILANHRAWISQMPKGTILTPHPKEFDRLASSPSNGSYERLNRAQELAETMHSYIILKGHYSALCMPDGHIVFNSTGNSGMATAGCGDVLTGIITALLARGYHRTDACLVGMYLHGLAGDLAAKELGKESLIASDIIDYLPKAFLMLSE